MNAITAIKDAVLFCALLIPFLILAAIASEDVANENSESLGLIAKRRK